MFENFKKTAQFKRLRKLMWGGGCVVVVRHRAFIDVVAVGSAHVETISHYWASLVVGHLPKQNWANLDST